MRKWKRLCDVSISHRDFFVLRIMAGHKAFTFLPVGVEERSFPETEHGPAYFCARIGLENIFQCVGRSGGI